MYIVFYFYIISNKLAQSTTDIRPHVIEYEILISKLIQKKTVKTIRFYKYIQYYEDIILVIKITLSLCYHIITLCKEFNIS